MPNRRQFALGCTVAAIAALGFSGTASAADYTMRISHQFPPTHHTALNIEQFAKEVKAATKGRGRGADLRRRAAVQAQPEPPGGGQRQDRGGGRS